MLISELRSAPWLLWAFVLAIAAFVLAALTGSLLRFGVLHGMPFGLQYLNVRHAHTHVMYFGWVTPALFALAGVELLRRRGRPLPRDLALFALDAAVLTLLVSSTGAWGLALAALSPVASGTLMDALVHFYLDLFSHGWFALALLGLLLAALPAPVEGRTAPVDGRMARAALLVLLASMLLAAFGALLGWPAAVVTALRLAAAWSQRMLLPVPLLHGYLLGFVTLTLVWLALRTWRPSATAAFWLAAAAVAVMLASLAPLTFLYPAGWRGPWVLPAAAWVSLLPTAAMAVVAVALVFDGTRAPREHRVP